MANPDAPFGFRCWKNGSGGIGGRVGTYVLPTAYGTAIYSGDCVLSSGVGIAGESAASLNVSTTNTDEIMGIFAGVKYQGADGSYNFRKSWVASTVEKTGTTIHALVYDDPMQLFISQCDGIAVIGSIGLFTGVVTTHAGSHVTGQSAQETAIGTGSETTFKIERLIGLSDQMPCRNAAGNPDFYTVGLNALQVVRIIKHSRGSVATTEV